jgi:hypothetical protein
MKKTINVTQEDIDNGNNADACACPVALALRRSFKVDDIWVQPYEMSANGHVYMNPSKVRDFINNFDRGMKVKPFKFELEN